MPADGRDLDLHGSVVRIAKCRVRTRLRENYRGEGTHPLQQFAAAVGRHHGGEIKYTARGPAKVGTIAVDLDTPRKSMRSPRSVNSHAWHRRPFRSLNPAILAFGQCEIVVDYVRPRSSIGQRLMDVDVRDGRSELRSSVPKAGIRSHVLLRLAEGSPIDDSRN